MLIMYLNFYRARIRTFCTGARLIDKDSSYSYIMVTYVYFFLDSWALSLVALVCIEVLSLCEMVSCDLSMQILL